MAPEPEIRPEPDERPRHLSEEPRSWALPVAAAGLLVVAILAGYYGGFLREPAPKPAAPRPAAAEAPKPASPAIRYPLPATEPAQNLPTLDMSDSMVREALVALVGSKAFNEFVIPTGLVRRIVATVDNLPRAAAPRRVFPLYDVPGSFATAGKGESLAIAPANPARYAAYVKVLETLDAAALVKTYVPLYPLFQRAYEELGFPGSHFNDRLVECLDDLLAAPEPAQPIRLLQPKVLYEYADPDLETHSAGQKILIRMGADNAKRVKAKLREIRRELLDATAARR